MALDRWMLSPQATQSGLPPRLLSILQMRTICVLFYDDLQDILSEKNKVENSAHRMLHFT